MRAWLIALSLMLSACAPDDGRNGLDGAQGPQGEKGDAGTPGSPCTVTQTEMGALIQCPDGTAALVLHGRNGADGKDCEKKKSRGRE